MLTGSNFILTLIATVLVVFFAPTAAGPGIPEIKAFLNGIDTPNMFGAPTLIVKVSLLTHLHQVHDFYKLRFLSVDWVQYFNQ